MPRKKATPIMASSQYEDLMKAIAALRAGYLEHRPAQPPTTTTEMVKAEDGTETEVTTEVPDDPLADPRIVTLDSALYEFAEHMKLR